MITLIAATGECGEIGKDNKLLWRMPADMEFFKRETTGRTIVMGRKTAESLGSPLFNRKNVVITRSGWVAKGFHVERSVENIIENYKNCHLYVIGGAEIYRAFMPYADELLITLVHGRFKDADTFFPDIDESFALVHQVHHDADEKNPYDYTFMAYKREK